MLEISELNINRSSDQWDSFTKNISMKYNSPLDKKSPEIWLPFEF